MKEGEKEEARERVSEWMREKERERVRCRGRFLDDQQESGEGIFYCVSEACDETTHDQYQCQLSTNDSQRTLKL